MRRDFGKYKTALIPYLNGRGIDTQSSPIRCFSPDHNDASPSMTVGPEGFKCMSCGFSGDVYRAVEVIEGITKPAEQYDFIEKFMGNAPPLPSPRQRKKADKHAVNTVIDYMKSNPHPLAIVEYLRQRKCTPEMIEKMKKCFLWWPGYMTAKEALGIDTLKAANIPGRNPKTDDPLWSSPGCVLQIGEGMKLFYYNSKGESRKISTKSACTFPYPKKLPDAPELILVEAEISVLSMWFAGFKNTAACGGVNGLTAENIRLLFGYKSIVLLFDQDAAGVNNADKTEQKMIKAGYKGEIFKAYLPSRKDPDDMVKEERINEIDGAIERAKKTVDDLPVERDDQTENNAVTDIFKIIGNSESGYYILHYPRGIILKVGLSDNNIKGMVFDLAPYGWWMKKLNLDDDEGLTKKCVTWLRREGQKSPMYDPRKILGVGAHRDGGKIIINTGDCLYDHLTKKITPIEKYTGELNFVRSTYRFELSGSPWTIKDAALLHGQISQYSFTREIDYMLLLGWLALAPFSSALDRRPHIAITGPAGCGKTWLIENVIKPAIGEQAIATEGETTEAGIRQQMGHDCRPVIIDEFEPKNREEEKKNEKILTLARSAYHGSGTVFKGTSDQKGRVFSVRSMFLFAAVNIVHTKDTDRSRIPVLRMRKYKKNSSQKAEILDFRGMRRRILDRLDVVLENIEQAKKYVFEVTGNYRKSDTIGTLLGGFWSLMQDSSFSVLTRSKSEDAAHIRSVITDALNEEESDMQPDEHLVIETILSSTIRVNVYEEMTVAELIELNEKEHETEPALDKNKVLQRHGIRRNARMQIKGTEYNCICFSARNDKISKMLENTPFSSYVSILERHPATMFEGKTVPVYIAGKTTRCIVMDWEIFEKMHIKY